MVKMRSQTRNITIKKEEEEDCKPTLGLGIVRNTRRNNKITKRKPSKNRTLPALQVKMEEDTDAKSLLKITAKADMLYSSAYHYYNRYLKDPNHNIPVSHLHQHYTQGQTRKFIGYVINDKMSISAASKKAKINAGTARNYYHKYFKVQNPDIPTPSHIATPTCYTQEQIKEVINYIVDGKMSIKAASKKANMNRHSSARHYRHYLNDNNIKIPVRKMH